MGGVGTVQGVRMAILTALERGVRMFIHLSEGGASKWPRLGYLLCSCSPVFLLSFRH